MSINEELLKKISTEFPQTQCKANMNLPLLSINGSGNDTDPNWSNGCDGGGHIFSFHPMEDCLKNAIEVELHYGLSGLHGWEICLKSNGCGKQTA